MTIEDLKNAGIIPIGGKINPNNFYIPFVGESTLNPPYSWEMVFDKIYNHAFEEGKLVGANQKVNEIKSVLNL